MKLKNLNIGASKMLQQAKAPPTKSEDLSLIVGTTKGKERMASINFSSGLHIWDVAPLCIVVPHPIKKMHYF